MLRHEIAEHRCRQLNRVVLEQRAQDREVERLFVRASEVASVRELAAALGVSPSTVRRRLARNGS